MEVRDLDMFLLSLIEKKLKISIIMNGERNVPWKYVTLENENVIGWD